MPAGTCVVSCPIQPHVRSQADLSRHKCPHGQAPGPAAQEAVKLSAEDAAAQKLENMVSERNRWLYVGCPLCSPRVSPLQRGHTFNHSLPLNRKILQGIRVNQEGERAKMSIKQVLEQRRINDATGALVKELFSNCTPETLDDKIEQIFREFDTDNSGGLDRSCSQSSIALFYPDASAQRTLSVPF